MQCSSDLKCNSFRVILCLWLFAAAFCYSRNKIFDISVCALGKCVQPLCWTTLTIYFFLNRYNLFLFEVVCHATITLRDLSPLVLIDCASLFSRLAVLSWFDTHPGSGGVATHPVTTKVIHHACEHRVSALRDRHILQRIQEVRLQT